MSHLKFALALALTIALAPLALDTYLPAFPVMAAAFDVTNHQLSLTVSIYIFTLSLGQLIAGPLADKWGRQRIMYSGLVVFFISSLGIALTTHYGLLLTLRAIQAFGGGWVLVCIPALVRDRAHGREAAKLFSLIGLIAVLAPAIAPLLGASLVKLGGWQTIFFFVTGYSLFVMIVLKKLIFTPDAPTKSHLKVAHDGALQRYMSVFKTPPALRFIALQALSFSIMMLFVANSSFIYQTHFNVSEFTFGLLFGANVVTMLLMNLLNRHLLSFFSTVQLLRVGITLQMVGLITLAIVMMFSPQQLWCFVPALMVTIGAMGMISPNNQANCMEYFPHNSGTAAALMGAIQFSTAGLLSALSTLLPKTVLAIVLAQGACVLVSLLLIYWPGQQPVPGMDE